MSVLCRYTEVAEGSKVASVHRGGVLVLTTSIVQLLLLREEKKWEGWERMLVLSMVSLQVASYK